MPTTIIFIQLKTSAQTQDLSANSRPQRKLRTARSEMHKKCNWKMLNFNMGFTSHRT